MVIPGRRLDSRGRGCSLTIVGAIWVFLVGLGPGGGVAGVPCGELLMLRDHLLYKAGFFTAGPVLPQWVGAAAGDDMDNTGVEAIRAALDAVAPASVVDYQLLALSHGTYRLPQKLPARKLKTQPLKSDDNASSGPWTMKGRVPMGFYGYNIADPP